MKSNTSNRSHSDFWLDEFEVGNDQTSDTTHLIRLNMARRAISNFVNILTGKVIPVVFNEFNQNLTDGNTVLLSADIEKNTDFDFAVGLSLHEGSHILLTDFRILQDIWQKVPHQLYKIAESKGFSKTDVITYVKLLFNVIEDRYIDRYVYSTAPGYRGYYQSLYQKFWHSDKITMMLKSSLYRSPTVESYEARIINLTNPSTDLSALPGLLDIAKVIDIKNIDRLKTTEDRFKVALEVARIIYTNVESMKDDDEKEVPSSIIPAKSNGSSKEQSQSDNNKSDEGNGVGTSDSDKSEKSKKSDNNQNNTSKTSKNETESEDDVDDILGGGNTSVDSAAPEKSKETSSKQNENSGVSKTKRDAIDKAISKQKDFINGNVKKKKVSQKENRTLMQIEKAGVTIVNVGKVLVEGSPLSKGIDCILVKNLTKDILFSDQFPCKYMVGKNNPIPDNINAVNRGVQLGTLLGRRLKVRNEINSTKYMRKASGKIDRRILSELGFDNENVFYRLDIDRYRKACIHISLDASGSMSGHKWKNSITSITAICKAASMIDNLRVSVSIRSTIASGITSLPFVAMVYDSDVDSFIKVRTLFPYLSPTGTTPEGLCYEAIMDMLGHKSTDVDYYFLNYSDGEPCFQYKTELSNGREVVYSYDQETGARHTRKQVKEIRNRGYKVMSYFINHKEYNTSVYNTPQETCFKSMYGQDAKFIDVTNIIGVAKTMNQMFLEKSNKI